ncbi:hypothetical protein FOXYS1_12737 [Fusarium oxysporum]|uniref:Uncharacterized protein n=1 Tax=Fusarium oxysporum TaxID=5507 RepID=A0A8H5A128_FUSOX|nr:hypothetical protein FOXYS1_12737 [Fusarium oxysporum]
MHFFKIILISLAPVLAMAATSPRDINSDEPFDFGQGFLVPANVSIDEYDSTPMISLSHLNPRDLASLKEPSLQIWETKIFFGKTQVDYACDASIKEPLGEAIHSICGNGDCDKSVVYTRKVVHMAGGNRKKDAWLRIAVMYEDTWPQPFSNQLTLRLPSRLRDIISR